MPEAVEAWLQQNPIPAQILWLALLFALATALYFVARHVIVVVIRRAAGRSETHWDDAFVEAGVFARLAHVVPALVVHRGIELVPGVDQTVETLLQRVAMSVVIVVVVASIAAMLNAVNTIYMANAANRSRPIKGYLQVAKIVLYGLAALLVLATLMDRSPLLFLSGLGAMTAILLLIFRDTILSFVASVLINAYDMVHVGDWIEMPKYGADGDVIDVALHTVKVQNWDKTITTIPTHALIDDAFKNWRGMELAGGRRIKRSFFVDVETIRFLEEDEVERLGRWSVLREYIAAKKREIEHWNRQPGRDASINADIRRLTNVGTLRAYIERYLRTHAAIHQGMTLLVRQLQPTEKGLPIEIYCFTRTTAWAEYEGIQADLFDHIFAILPDLGLRAFQSPSGADVVAIARAQRAAPAAGARGGPST